MTQPAQVLAPGDVRVLLTSAGRRRHAARSRAMILLSCKAGLRACEIAGLDWMMVCQADGRIARSIAIPGAIAKNGRGRRIPMHADLHFALEALHAENKWATSGPVILSQRGTHMTPRSVVNWFAALFAEAGLDGCSSHSGRRTFITNAARLISKAGGSLRDVQELAGHRSLTTTERYIEGDRDAQRKLVRLL